MSEAQEKTVKLLDSKLDAAVIKTVTTCAIVMIVAVLIHDGDHIRQALNWGYSIPLSLWVLNLTVYVLPVVTLFLAKSGRPSATLVARSPVCSRRRRFSSCTSAARSRATGACGTTRTLR